MYDLLVVGSGPGGYVAAIRAAQLGMKAAVVERAHLGGICLNWGCIPTKSLLRSSDVLTAASRGREFGLNVQVEKGPALGPVIKRSRAVAGQLNGGVAYLLKKNKVAVIAGDATLVGDGKVEVRKPAAAVREQFPLPADALGEGTYSAKHIIVATGARPRSAEPFKPDGKLIWTYFEAMSPDIVPATLAIAGSGAIGIEFASFYRSMGSEVTLIEMRNRVMPAEDAEISQLMQRRLTKRGIKVLTSAKIERVEKKDDEILLTVQDGKGESRSLVAQRMISAIGAEANIAGLGLQDLGVRIENGFIAVGSYGRTNIEGIYAIGDVTGAPMLAHRAEHQGVVCVEAIAGRVAHSGGKVAVPACTYGDPQVASIGLTEDAAKAAYREIKVGRFPFSANGKAIALGEPEGLVKVIFDETSGRLLGAHMIGAEVTELIHGFAIALKCGATFDDLTQTMFPHPTISEVIYEASLQAEGRAIHV